MKRTVHFLPNSLGALLCVSFIIMLVSSFAPTVSTHPSILQAGLPTPTPCLDKAVCGEWEQVDTSWPIAPIHMHVLPNGKVLAWSRDKKPPATPNPDCPTGMCDIHGNTKTYIWDPDPGPNPPFTQVDNTQTNLFCAGHSFLSDGQLLVTGGHFLHDGSGEPHTNVFDFSTNSWFRPEGSDMNLGRWYPTSTTLGNGEVLVVGGGYRVNPGNKNEESLPNMLPQVWQNGSSSPPATVWRNLDNALYNIGSYPWMPLMPDPYDQYPNGRVLLAGPGPATRILNLSNSGSWIDLSPGPIFRSYGSPVIFSDGSSNGNNNVNLLLVGGADGVSMGPDPTTQQDRKISVPVNTAVYLNMRDSFPTRNPAGTMYYPRWFHNATLLPDEKVVVTGGSKGQGNNGWPFPDTQHEGVYFAEMWDPMTKTFSPLAHTNNYPNTTAQVRRLYHSVAVLLPDGRVLSGGGGLPAPSGDDNCRQRVEDPPGRPFCNDYGHKDVEIYRPPYFFNADGTDAARPQITSAPISAGYGETFAVMTPDGPSISKVTLIRLSSVTHAYNMDQRINRLAYSQVPGGLYVTAPSNPNECPPGYYMLFILNSNGVPSIAKIIRIANWQSLGAPPGGGAPDGPAVSAWAPANNQYGNPNNDPGKPGRFDVFIQGLDNALWHKATNNRMRWDNWESLGGVISSKPAAVSWARNRIDVIVRGNDNQSFFHRSYNGSGWSNWLFIGCCSLSAPAVSSWGPNRLDVFMQGGDFALWHKSYNGSAWSGWEKLGGILSSTPAAVSRISGRIDVVVRGSDNNTIYHTSYNGSGWSPFVSLGCCSSGAPAITSSGSDRLDVFIRGLDGALWHKRWKESVGWSAEWIRLGGALNSDPAPVSWGKDKIDVFAQGLDNSIMYK